MPATHIIVIGASAGGIAAVRTLLNKFPERTPAPPDYHLIVDGPAIVQDPDEGKRQSHG